MGKKKITTKTLVICIMVVLLIANVTAGLTGAFFTSNDGDSSSSDFGIIELGDLGEVPIKMIKGEASLDVLMPGDKIEVKFGVSNAGTADMLVRYKLSTTGDGASSVTTVSSTPSNYTMVDFDSVQGGPNTGVQDWWAVRNTVLKNEDGTIDNISMLYELLATLKNDYAGKTVNFTLVVQAVQAANMVELVDGNYTTIEDWDLNSIEWPAYDGPSGDVTKQKPTFSGITNFFVEQGSTVDYASGVTASDLQDGDLTEDITINTEGVNLNEPSDYTIEYIVTDSDGNIATETATVIVYSNDMQEPILGGASIINTAVGSPIDYESIVVAYDAQDGDISDNIVINDAGIDFNQAKDYVIECTVTDSNGNKVTKTLLIRVMDENTVDNVFEIENVRQLFYVAEQTNNDASFSEGKRFELKNNIDLDGYYWTSIGTENSPFKGEFDGNGFTIFNVKILEQLKDNVGFFGYVEEATIENVNLSNVDIQVTGGEKVGALVGKALASTIKDIIIKSGKVEVTETDNNYNIRSAGGVIGYAERGSISNLTNNAFVEAKYIDFVGGIIGQLEQVDASNLTNNGKVEGNRYVGGIVGIFNNGIAANFVNNGYVVANYISGSIAGSVLGQMFEEEITNNGTFTLYGVDEDILMGKKESHAVLPASKEPLVGDGSIDNPYIIETAQNLGWLRSNVFFGRTEWSTGKYYKLANDINLEGYYWVSIGLASNRAFAGHFDGNGYTVYNLITKEGETEDISLFDYITEEATVINVNVGNGSVMAD